MECNQTAEQSQGLRSRIVAKVGLPPPIWQAGKTVDGRIFGLQSPCPATASGRKTAPFPPVAAITVASIPSPHWANPLLQTNVAFKEGKFVKRFA